MVGCAQGGGVMVGCAQGRGVQTGGRMRVRWTNGGGLTVVLGQVEGVTTFGVWFHIHWLLSPCSLNLLPEGHDPPLLQ